MIHRKKEYILTTLLFTCAIIALCIKPLCSIDLIINAHDIMRIHYFFKSFIVNTIKQTGEFPLWNPISYSGMPITANPQTCFYYPPYWLFLIIPVHYCFTVLIVSHLIWGSIGTFVYLRNLSLSWYSAVLGTIVFIFNLKVIGQIHAGHTNILYSVMYIPWIMLAADNLLSKKNLSALILYSICCTMIFFIGHTQMFYYMIAISAVYICIRSLRETHPQKTKIFLLYAGAGTLTLILCAILLLPLLEFSRVFNRAGGTDLSFASSMSLRFKDAILDMFNPSKQLLHPTFYELFWEKTVYIGWIPCLLAFFSWKNRKLRFYTYFFGGLILFGLFFSFGEKGVLFTVLYYIMPGIKFFRVPSRMWFFAVYGFSVLSAIGLQYLSKHITSHTVKIFCAVLASVTLSITLFYLISFNKQLVYFPVIVSLASMTILVFLCHKKIINHTFILQLCILLLTFIDLWILVFPLITVKNVRSIIPPQSTYLKILKDNDIFRVYDSHRALPQHTAAYYGIQKINGIDTLLIQTYIDFIHSLYDPAVYNPPILTNTLPITDENLAKLNFLNVKYLFSWKPMQSDSLIQISAATINSQDINHAFYGLFYTDDFYSEYFSSKAPRYLFTYRNNNVLPRAFMIPVKNQDPYLLDYTIKQTALKKSPLFGETKIIKYSPNTIIIETTVQSSAFLFTSELFYPGWNAEIDGNTTQIIPVFNLFRGVFVPAGTHTISFIFAPRSFLWGKWITLASSVFCLLFGIITCLKRIYYHKNNRPITKNAEE